MTSKRFDAMPQLPVFPSLPAAGSPGRLLYYNGRPYYDNGTVWVSLPSTLWHDSSGNLITDGRRACEGTSTTDANGDCVANYAAMGYSAQPKFGVTGIRGTTTDIELAIVNVRSVGLNTAAITISRGANIGILGAQSIRRNISGLTVTWVAYGA